MIQVSSECPLLSTLRNRFDTGAPEIHKSSQRPSARAAPAPPPVYTYLVAVERPPTAVGLLAPPRHHVHHSRLLVGRAEAGPLALEPVAGLPLAILGRTPAAPHVDHGGRLVEGAELGLLSLFLVRSAGKEQKY